ncbi:MAG: metalloregulator ArsR/SmtB family transcription factor [Streptococcaceae bacterium]|nr:metalloregulator ArsR/SmtB family transcription factor [Streptococcaceae bacterium]
MDYEELADFFKLFTNINRIKIVMALAKKSMNVAQIEEEIDISQSLVSQSLKHLKQARIVTSVRSGKQVIYSLYDNHIVEILESVLAHSKE